jgi:hypothetical protein
MSPPLQRRYTLLLHNSLPRYPQPTRINPLKPRQPKLLSITTHPNLEKTMCQICTITTLSTSARWPKPLGSSIADLHFLITCVHDQHAAWEKQQKSLTATDTANTLNPNTTTALTTSYNSLPRPTRKQPPSSPSSALSPPRSHLSSTSARHGGKAKRL